MSSGLVHWDTCVLLAWILGEKRSDSEREGLQRAAEAFDNGKLILLTSVIARTEIFQGELTEEQRQRYRDLFRRPRFQEVDVTRPVAELAAVFRARAKKTGRNLRTPDAIHLATAAYLKARELHTFDAKLFSLSETELVGGLKVCVPDFVDPKKAAVAAGDGVQQPLPLEGATAITEAVATTTAEEAAGEAGGVPSGDGAGEQPAALAAPDAAAPADDVGEQVPSPSAGTGSDAAGQAADSNPTHARTTAGGTTETQDTGRPSGITGKSGNEG